MAAVLAATEGSIDSAVVNDSQTRDEVKVHSEGAAVVRMQILLDRAHFSPGEIDSRYGDNLRVALLGYQHARQLPETGEGDGATWDALNADTSQVLVSYAITPDETTGPFEQIPRDMMEQAKLKSLGYTSPAEELGERFHISPELLERLNPGKDLTKSGEQILVPNVQRESIVPATQVVVSKSRRTVSAIAGDGTLLAQYPATIGSEHDPLAIGQWRIVGVQQNPKFNYNPDLFWDASPEHSKAQIQEGPNNPVGVVWIGLSKDHYGIHGSPEPSKIGHTSSHGCIRLTNWDAEELSRMVSPAYLRF